MEMDLIERLSKWRDIKIGDPLPHGDWPKQISDACADAIVEIERLRSIIAFTSSPGLDWRTIKDGL